MLTQPAAGLLRHTGFLLDEAYEGDGTAPEAAAANAFAVRRRRGKRPAWSPTLHFGLVGSVWLRAG